MRRVLHTWGRAARVAVIAVGLGAVGLGAIGGCHHAAPAQHAGEANGATGNGGDGNAANGAAGNGADGNAANGANGNAANGGGSAVAPKPKPTRIKIVVRSNPPKAFVSWGKKQLGQTPVTIERWRDSGPVDLVIRAEGYFPLHTRAYTFRNDALSVRLTKLTDRMSLFGAKREEPAPPPPPATAEGATVTRTE